AALDAGGGLVEPRPETQSPSSTPRADGALRRAGPARWQFSSVVRSPRAIQLFVDAGGRCDGSVAGPFWRAGDDLGRRGGAPAVDRGVRHAARAVRRLEKRLCS